MIRTRPTLCAALKPHARRAAFLILAMGALGASWACADDANDITLPEPGIPPKGGRGVFTARTAKPADIPDIYGPGSVLDVGNLHLKVTNIGVIGNPYTHLSSDPSAQWPGASGVEYLNAIVLAVGAVNPGAIDPSTRRRVSSGSEWRPPTLDPVDRIYRSFEGIANGRQLINDDSDINVFTGERRIDEEFLDGHDNDGDGWIDEDYAAFGHLMFSCLMRDDTPAAQAIIGNEQHVPIGLECRQQAWAYSVPGYANFDVIEYTIFNRSGHELDSLYIGFPTDLDAGSVSVSAGYYVDDQDLPFFPNGVFRVPISDLDPRYQRGLCRNFPVTVQGFSVVDGDGDHGATPGVVSFLLFGHTIDPLGLKAPTRVGFTSFRSFRKGASYASNGAPTIDRQRFDLMSSRENIEPITCPNPWECTGTGFITQPPLGIVDDHAAWNSIGPFLDVPDGGSVTATIGLAVSPGSYADLVQYPADYQRYQAGVITLDELFLLYPAVENAVRAQVAYEGLYERPRLGFGQLAPSCPGCETGLRLPPGSEPILVAEPKCSENAEPALLRVTDAAYTWFNFDCNFCTGVAGYYLRRWDTLSPPSQPNVNVVSSYNYSDNPDRIVVSGDRQVTLAWDNISETIADPKTGWFDFRAYRIWKVSQWQRPVGSSGPTDKDWSLLAEFRYFDHRDSNFSHDPITDTLVCPMVLVPNHYFPPGHERCAPERASQYPGRVMMSQGGCRDTATVGICLRRGDLWDPQSGEILHPDPTVDCVRDSTGQCVRDVGRILGRSTVTTRTRYPIGRYRFVDREVKNGFTYFYSISAGDSAEGFDAFFGRHQASEVEAVVPQAATGTGQSAWVVPNPYRGYHTINERPSAWDLNPNATDPTGTHVDFMGLPRGRWTIRIYTLAGDLVAELHSTDPVNDSVRGPVNFNRQQDNPNDGQARWNLVSRNGQDVASGIYLFVVDSQQGKQRGKFVIIR